MIVLVIGYGSMGKKHVESLKNIGIKDIHILSKQKKIPFKTINRISEINKVNPDYIIIANETSKHYQTLKYLENNFKNKKILVEKPLFHKFKYLKIKKNKVFVGYNLRLHPIINLIKKKIKKQKIWYASTCCESYLPNWRKNIPYEKSNSSSKKKGGGVLLELSHEIDYFLYFFSSFKLNNVFNKKISNLRINTDDILDIIAYNKDIKFINIKLNFFSRKNIRTISMEGNKISINADLVNYKIKIIENNSEKNYKFKKLDILNLYGYQHKLIMKEKYKNLCTYQEGVRVMKYIKKIKEY